MNMTISTAHSILEDRQRIMTQYRYLFTDEERKANGMAILAIKKQIPMPVKSYSIEKPPLANLYTLTYVCPSCREERKEIPLFYEPSIADMILHRKNLCPPYCINCGQALDWSLFDSREERE